MLFDEKHLCLFEPFIKKTKGGWVEMSAPTLKYFVSESVDFINNTDMRDFV